jgi:hypothetical protein
MRFHIEPQQLANRVCEVVFFFLDGLVRVLPIPLSPNGRSIPSRTHPFRDSQKESDQESFPGVGS